MNSDRSITRPDIQALRGYAVLLVVLYHSGVDALRSGFLGVDVFFVISGFLITGLIVRGLEAGTFGIGTFYLRRAKRLLPAAYATLVATALAAPFFLIPSQLAQFREQLEGAVSFTANIVLWHQSGYFDEAAVTKPLLHFWSLAVEEQYYFLMPLTLMVVPRGWRLRIVVGLTVASLAYCFLLAAPSAKFYLIFSRAWELGLGSLAALASREWAERIGSLFWLALAILVTVPFVKPAGTAPDLTALAVCSATLVVILRCPRTAPAPIAFIGDFSYSLYLVHWPIIVFARSAYFGQEPPVHVLVLAFAASLVAGYGLYRIIERPIHQAPMVARRFVPAIASASALLLAIAFFPLSAAAPVRQLNFGLAGSCDQSALFQNLPECSTTTHPKMLVWGDSHAMHLVPGLKDAEGGIGQATRSACGPFLGIAPFLDASPVYSREAAKTCIKFNDSVVKYIATDASIEVVVLAAALSLYRPHLLLMDRDGNERPATAVEVANAAMTTAAVVRKLGKRLVIVGSPPWGAYDIGACTERVSAGLLSLGAFADCRVSIDRYKSTSAPEIALLATISERAGIPVVRLSDFLCRNESCETMIEGNPLYLDDAHLTVRGSEALGREMNLPDALKRAAN